MFNKEKIKELYPEAIMYESMKIHNSTDISLKKACESNNYFGQLKKDGYWYQYEHHKNNSYLFSRTVSKTTGLLTEKSANVPHIINALNALPPDTILVGEIYYPGGSSKNVTEIMGCLSSKAIERQKGKHGLIHYYIHDIIMYDGIDFVKAQTDNETRYKILAKIFEIYNLKNYEYLELAEVWYDDLYTRVGEALSAGEEGMVLKKKTGVYEPGKRPDSNLKAKKVDFADVIIIGFEKPTELYYGKEIESWQYWRHKETGKTEYGFFNNDINYEAITKPCYMAWNNARIKIGAYDKDGNIKNIGTIHSGISDEMKKNMSENPEKYLNKVCKIQCMEKDKKEHTIRHGFFRGLRDDKNMEECTLEQIF